MTPKLGDWVVAGVGQDADWGEVVQTVYGVSVAWEAAQLSTLLAGVEDITAYPTKTEAEEAYGLALCDEDLALGDEDTETECPSCHGEGFDGDPEYGEAVRCRRCNGDGLYYEDEGHQASHWFNGWANPSLNARKP